MLCHSLAYILRELFVVSDADEAVANSTYTSRVLTLITKTARVLERLAGFFNIRTLGPPLPVEHSHAEKPQHQLLEIYVG